jgi:hypothetical protein
MPAEQYEYLSRPRPLLSDEHEERLLRLVNNTGSLKLFDYVSNLLVIREAERNDSESTDVLLDYLVEKRDRVEEIVALRNQFDTLTADEDDIAFDEEVRIALFKPLGE